MKRRAGVGGRSGFSFSFVHCILYTVADSKREVIQTKERRVVRRIQREIVTIREEGCSIKTKTDADYRDINVKERDRKKKQKFKVKKE
jgi:hypothetical protein